MGKWDVKVVRKVISHDVFVPMAGNGWRAQIESGAVRRAAAQRLDLDLIEHAIGLCDRGASKASISGHKADFLTPIGEPATQVLSSYPGGR